MYRILITGSREWTDQQVIYNAVLKAGRSGDIPPNTVVVHGTARGADTLAEAAALSLGCRIERHPAKWDIHGKRAGHIRNAEMVALGADICLAFPIGQSRGTRGCMALAQRAGIPVVVHEGVLIP